jgi:dipeptidyl aminopeptidase/acylaminoacyl peptidase
MAADVWVYALASGTLSRLTFDGRSFPIWSPDSRRIAYQSVKDYSVLMKTADGSGAEETLQPHTPDPILPGSWSPDGRRVAVTSLGPTNEVLLIAPGEEPTLFETDASAPAFSPDGRWIAYASPPTGSTHVFVRPVSGPGKWQVSPEIGSYPRWSGDGQRPLMVVSVASGDSFRPGPPRTLIPDLTRYVTATAPVVDWDAAPSGDRFAFVELERAAGEGTRIDVALNWARHLAVARSGGSAPGR